MNEYVRTDDYEELESSVGQDHPPVLTLEFGGDHLKCIEGTAVTLTMMLSKDSSDEKLRPVAVIGIGNAALPIPGSFYYMDSAELDALSRTTTALAQMLRDETLKFERENAVVN